MDPKNCDSPFTDFCLSYLSPISDLSYIPITPFQEKLVAIVQIPAKRQPQPENCNCKKSHCRKMHCECFSHGKFCQNCGCSGCKNVNNKKKLIGNLKKGSCSCKKSGCNKNYCECYHLNRRCGENCKCEDCKNNEILKELKMN